MSGDHARSAQPLPPRPSDAPVGDIAVSTELIDEHWLVLRVTGEIDMVTAPTLLAEVDRQLGPAASLGDWVVVFDLSGTSFLASSGLAVLARAAQLAAERSLPSVRVIVTSRAVRRPIEVTGLDSVLEMYTEPAAATQPRTES